MENLFFGGQARVNCCGLQARGGLQLRQQQSKGSNNFWGQEYLFPAHRNFRLYA